MRGLCPHTPAKGPDAGPLDARASVTLDPIRVVILRNGVISSRRVAQLCEFAVIFSEKYETSR